MMKEKAIIFVGYQGKKSSVLFVKQKDFKAILLTKKASSKAVELFDEVLEKNFMDLKEINSFIPYLKKKYKIQGIITDYEHFVVARSYLAEKLNVPSSSLYGAASTRNKAMQRHALSFMEENIDFRIVKNAEEATKAFKALGGDVYLKFTSGIKSRFIFHLKEENKIKDIFNDLKLKIKNLSPELYEDYQNQDFPFKYPDPKNIFLVEKAEYGQQISVQSFASRYNIWHAPSVCDVYPAESIGKKDSFLAFRILPSKLPHDIIHKAQKTAETAGKILGLYYCPIYVELIVKPDKSIKLIEMASRIGGYRPQMYQEAYHIDLYDILIKSAFGNKILNKKKATQYVSMMEIFPEKEGIFKGLENFQKVKDDPKVEHFRVTAKSGELKGLAKMGHSPCARFLIKGNSYEEVYEKSLRYQKELKVSLN